MNLVLFPIYNYINIALSAMFILLALFLKSDSMQLLIVFVPLIIAGLSMYTLFKKTSLTDTTKKNVVLVAFIGSIIVSFSPYILQFSTNKQLLFSSLAFTILLLINIFLVKLENKEK
ncbi:MAG: hypothetical protein H7196_01255 [candidate division SR1 bacterium]|nr:hypothetical protein [candidate division SR1 bacterium]